MPEQASANWYPDPFGRHAHRYWDGRQWTHHVASHGLQSVDPPTPAPPAAASSQTPTGLPEQTYGHPHLTESRLLTEPILIVSQKARLHGSNVEYAIRNQHGLQVGAVQEVGRGILRKAKDRHRNRTDNTREYRLHIVNSRGQVLMAIARPRLWLKSKMIVMSPDGRQIGQIAQETLGVIGGFPTVAHAALTGWTQKLDSAVEGLDKIGHVRFRVESGGQVLGSIHAENLEAWDFNVRDANGLEIAQITKTWAGWTKERFTKADNYVVQIYRPLEEPVRSLVIAASLAVDIALKQGHPSRSRGALSPRSYQ